uniref:Uncharacterized protein n=1 Tax=Glossina austeni TaxID=7395 RepID=A0A1A9VNL3_GLOAU
MSSLSSTVPSLGRLKQGCKWNFSVKKLQILEQPKDNKDYSGPLLNSGHQWLNDQPNASEPTTFLSSSLTIRPSTIYLHKQAKLCKQQLLHRISSNRDIMNISNTYAMNADNQYSDTVDEIDALVL